MAIITRTSSCCLHFMAHLKLRMSLMMIMMMMMMMASTSLAASCSYCPAKHLQQHYCDSDIVMKGRVQSNMKLKISTIYKGAELLPTKAQKRLGLAAPDCQKSKLTPGNFYLIMGSYHDNILHIGPCDVVEDWTSLTSIQREGIKEVYQLFCHQCSINSTYSIIRPELDLDSLWEENFVDTSTNFWRREDCFYNPLASRQYMVDDCETKYSVCVPQGDGHCSWLLSGKYVACEKKRKMSPCLEQLSMFAVASWQCPEDCLGVTQECLREKCLRDTEGIDCSPRYEDVFYYPELTIEK